VALVIARS